MISETQIIWQYKSDFFKRVICEYIIFINIAPSNNYMSLVEY